MATSKIKGITIEIGGDTTKLGKALEGVNTKTRNLQSELKGVNTLLKLDPSNTELLTQKQTLLKEAIANTKEKLDTLKTAQKQVQEQFEKGEITEEQYRDLQREIVATEQKLKSLTNELREFGSVGAQKVAEVGEKMKSAGESIENAGKKVAPASAVATAGLIAVTKEAIDFESAWAGVTKTVDGTPEQLETIKQGLLDMSQETASSAEDIAAVAEAAGQLGIKTENILDFTKTMVMLGDTTNLSADEASSALAKFSNITGMSADDYGRLGATIVDLGNNFATTESDIVAMATRLASTGEITGLTEPQIMALATALSSAGIEAEAGGSSMAKLLKQLYSTDAGFDTAKTVIDSTGVSLRDLQLMESNNSKGFKELADSLGLTKTELSGYMKNVDQMNNYAATAGVSVEEFRRAYGEDAVGALSLFIQGLNNTEQNGKSAVEILNDMGITEVRLSNAVLAMASSGDLMTSAIETANNAWGENTALTAEAEKRYNTTESKIVQLKNTVSELAVKLGNILLPILEKIIGAVSKFVEWLTNLSPATQTVILIITGLVASLAPLLITVGKVITSVGTIMTIVPKIVGLFNVVKTAMIGLNAVMMANPIALIIAAVAALIAIFVTLYNKCEWFRNGVNAVFEGIKNAVIAVIDWFKSLPEKIKSFFNGIIEFVKNNWQSLLLLLVNPFAGAFKLLYEKCDGFRNFVNTFVQKIVEFFKSIPEKLAPIFEFVQNIFNKLPTGFQLVVHNVKNILDGFVNIFKNIFNIIKTVVETVISVIKALFSGEFASIGGIVSEALEKIKGFFTNILDSIVTIIVNWIAIAINYFRGVGETIVQIFTTIGETLVSWWENIKNFFTVKVPEIISNIVAWFAELPGKIWDAIVSAVTKIAEWGARVNEKAKSVVSSAITAVVNFFKELPGKIWNAITSAVTKIGEWGVNMKNKAVTAMKNMVTGIIDTVKGLPGKFLSIGKDIISGLWNGISGAVSGLYENIKGCLSGLVDKAKDALGINSPSRVFAEVVGKQIPAGIAQGIDNNTDVANQAVEAMTDDLTNEAVKLNGATINRKLNTTFTATANNTGSISDVMATIREYGEKLIQASKRSIVLDSGVLVGETIGEIDAGLASLQLLKGRGV